MRKSGTIAYDKNGHKLGIYLGEDKGYNIIQRNDGSVFLYSEELWPVINLYRISVTDPQFYNLKKLFGFHVCWDSVVEKNNWKYLTISVTPSLKTISVSAISSSECNFISKSTEITYEEAILILAGARE